VTFAEIFIGAISLYAGRDSGKLYRMMRHSPRAIIFLSVAVLALAPTASAAEPATPAATWQRAIGPWAWSFPRDHGAHPNFKSEWWYFTGNLKEDGTGRPFGYQLTIFRQGVQIDPAQKNSKWAMRDFYFGHLTISDIAKNEFHVAEKVSRGALGEAHAATDGMDVAIGNWTITTLDTISKWNAESIKEHYALRAKADDMAIDLLASPLKPLVLEGVNGLSQKSSGAGNASYYYSFPRLETSGHLTLAGKTYDVSGLSWFDHEFSTSSLSKNEIGWDWFCIQLGSNEEIMLYALRDKSGAIDPASEGTWVKADGTSERLLPGSFTITKTGTWKSPHSGATYPAGWHIIIPSHQADLTVAPAMADQELNLTKMGKLSYWEGACTIAGRVGNADVKGVGYTELTGYAGALQTEFKE
jgi:predicted secreted hydrolase